MINSQGVRGFNLVPSGHVQLYVIAAHFPSRWPTPATKEKGYFGERVRMGRGET